MKRIILGLAVAGAICFSFTTSTNDAKSSLETVEAAAGSVQVYNDTGSSVKLYTGSGSVNLGANGGKTSFTCGTGRSVKANGRVIFKNTSNFCGKKVYLSNYI